MVQNMRQRKPKRQYNIDNSEKLATQDTQDEEKKQKTQHNANTNYVNKTCVHLPTTGGKGESNNVLL